MASPALFPLANYTFANSTTASISITSIDQTYKDLILIINGGATVTGDNIRYTFNSDSGANYSGAYLTTNGTGSTATTYSASAYGLLFSSGNYTTSTTNFTTIEMNIKDYTNTNLNKIVLSTDNNGEARSEIIASRWASSSAITSMQLTCPGTLRFTTGTTVCLYGVKG